MTDYIRANKKTWVSSGIKKRKLKNDETEKNEFIL